MTAKKRESAGGGLIRIKRHHQLRLLDPEGDLVTLDRNFRRDLVREFRRRQRLHNADQNPPALDVLPAAEVRSTRKVRFAQPAEPGQLNWIPLGPAVMKGGQAATFPPVSGRVRGLAISADGRRVYAAAANGGVWRSDDGGGSWYPLMDGFDRQPMVAQSDSQSAGAVAIHPLFPDRIYLGSGEGFASYYGVGPVVSEDGGLNWRTEPTTPAAFPTEFFQLAVDPVDPEIVVAATDQGLFRRQPRNQDVAGLPYPRPQSYFLQYNSNTGVPAIDYWDPDGLNRVNAWTGAAGGAWQGNLIFAPVWLNKEPHFVAYNPAGGAGGADNYFLYRLPGNAQPAVAGQGTWGQNLRLMPFQLSGTSYLVRYHPGTGVADLLKWNDDGTTTTEWQNEDWGTGYTLVPLVLGQVPMFLRYRGNDGQVMLRRWRANLMPVDAWAAVRNWDANRRLMQFSVKSQPLTLTYAQDGSATLYRWDSTDPQVLWTVGANGMPAGSLLIPYEVKTTTTTEPRFMAYRTAAPGRGITFQYAWTPMLRPAPFRKEALRADLSFLPLTMGFEWADRQGTIEPPPMAGAFAARRASSVVVAREGDVTVWFAAFWYPITQNAAEGQQPIYYSLDGGQSWYQLGFFANQQGRITLAVQPTNSHVVYAFTEIGSVFRLERGGGPAAENWNQVLGVPEVSGLLGTQGNYDLSLAVAPDNPDRIYLGGSATLASVAGYVQPSASLYRCEVTAHGALIGMSPVYIGFSVHADVQTLVFDSQGGLWVGCDGGVFYAPLQVVSRASDNDYLFQAMNTGLSTLQVNRLGQWPTEDAVLFASCQDNGCVRYTGSQAWELVTLGDSGRVVVNWNDPSKVINTYTGAVIQLSATAGAPVTFFGTDWISGTISYWEQQQYLEPLENYAPLVGTPRDGTPAHANRLAFGTTRPWISNDFGMSWYPINTLATANVPTGGVFPPAPVNDPARTILSMCFTSYTSLYVGTRNGLIYRIREHPAGTWTPEALNGKPVAAGALPVGLPITDMALDPNVADAVYICYGGPPQAGANGFRRVWHYNPAGGAGGNGQWTSTSGNGGADTSLLNLQYNAVAAEGNNVYAAADIGIWHSANDGGAWVPFAQGLPESAILDLEFLGSAGNRPNLLRAGSYGRGVYEKVLDNVARYRQPVQIFARAHVLDRGLYNLTGLDGRPNPENLPGPAVHHRDGIGIKVTEADAGGNFPYLSSIDFYHYDAIVQDSFRQVHRGRRLRFYVEVANRGVVPADTVQVMVLISRRVAAQPVAPIPVPAPPVTVDPNISPLAFNTLAHGDGPQAPAVISNLPAAPGAPANSRLAGLTGPPNLPATLQNSVRAGSLIRYADWQTVAILTFDDLRAGFPQIVSADWTAPNPGLYYLVALLNSPQDLFTQAGGAAIDVDNMVQTNSLAIMKCLLVYP